MSINTKPRVLFSNPPWWVLEKPFVFTGDDRTAGVRAGSRWPFTYTGYSRPGNRDLRDYMPYPFFMGYAATYVQQKTGANVRLRDSIALRESYDSYFLYLLQNRFDVIFIETASPCWEHDARLIDKIKKMLPETVIAVCGPLATNHKAIVDTYLGLEYLGSEVPVAAAIKGEYEKGAVRVVEGARGVIDFDLLTLEEMNAAPFPYFDPLIWNKYWDSNPHGQQAPQLQCWTSRGCPYKCIFCVWPAAMTGNDPDGTGKRAVRQYHADYMIGFLKEMVGRYAFKSIYFDDDTFNLGDWHVRKMCESIEASGVSLPWSAMCRADSIRRETWKMMKDSGCFGVKIGFESGNQHVVDEIVNKRLDLDQAKETVAYLHEIGMTVHGTFTYGLPGETREQMADTKRYIQELLKLGMDTYQESGCAEIEGAPLKTLSERGTLVAFPAARVDVGYRPMANGSEKLEAMRKPMGRVDSAVPGKPVDKYQDPDIEGWMSLVELQWLFETAHEMNSIAEVGSFKGRSTHALASGCPGFVTCVDHFSPEHLLPIIDDSVYRAFGENTKEFSNILVSRGWSVQQAAKVPDGYFDMVFIDAHHTYESALADIKAWTPKARRLICGHDYVPGWPGVIRAVDESFTGVEHCETIWYKWLDPVPVESEPLKEVFGVNCEKCGSAHVEQVRETVGHEIKGNEVIHGILDEMVCHACGSVWLQSREAAPGSQGVETPSPAAQSQESGTKATRSDTQARSKT